MTRPLFDSSGFASALGRLMSTPPCIIGAVIMKITNSSSITSIRLTTLMSALRSKRCRRRIPGISDSSLADEKRDHGHAEALERAIEAIETSREDVVPKCGRNGDGERGCRGDQGFGDARRNRGQIPRALRCDAEKCIDHAQHCSEEPDQRTRRADRRQPGKESTDAVALRRGVAVQEQMQRLE